MASIADVVAQFKKNAFHLLTVNDLHSGQWTLEAREHVTKTHDALKADGALLVKATNDVQTATSLYEFINAPTSDGLIKAISIVDGIAATSQSGAPMPSDNLVNALYQYRNTIEEANKPEDIQSRATLEAMPDGKPSRLTAFRASKYADIDKQARELFGMQRSLIQGMKSEACRFAARDKCETMKAWVDDGKAMLYPNGLRWGKAEVVEEAVMSVWWNRLGNIHAELMSLDDVAGDGAAQPSKDAQPQSETSQAEVLLTHTEAWKRAKCDKSTMTKYINKGVISTRTIGGKRKIVQSSLDAAIVAGTVKAKIEAPAQSGKAAIGGRTFVNEKAKRAAEKNGF